MLQHDGPGSVVLAEVDSFGDHPSGCRDVGMRRPEQVFGDLGVAGDPLEQRPGVVEHRQTQQESRSGDAFRCVVGHLETERAIGAVDEFGLHRLKFRPRGVARDRGGGIGRQCGHVLDQV